MDSSSDRRSTFDGERTPDNIKFVFNTFSTQSYLKRNALRMKERKAFQVDFAAYLSYAITITFAPWKTFTTLQVALSRHDFFMVLPRREGLLIHASHRNAPRLHLSISRRSLFFCFVNRKNNFKKISCFINDLIFLKGFSLFLAIHKNPSNLHRS